MSAKTVIVAVVALVAGSLVGGYGGLAVTRSAIASDWLSEQAADVEDRVAVLRQLRAGHVDQAVESLEQAIDADLIGMVVDRFIREATVARIHEALDATQAYRAAHPRHTGHPFVDDNVAARLGGDLTH